ncbi:MAG: hypothetical protein QOH96_1401 [Blastocatellia bacterium]|jgi:hypothetical protein|nr:hypothetical protein [Blastocatellia bacterium]
MNKRVLPSLLVVTVVFGLTGSNWLLANRQASAQKRQESLLPNDRDRITKQLKADISQLASTPRYSKEQYARAVAYVRSQAQAAGLDAVIEPVEGVSQWERGDSDRCDLLLPNGSTEPFRLVALTTSAGGDVEGEVVLVNYFFDKNQGPPPQRFDEGKRRRIVFFSRSLERDRSDKGYIKTVPQRNDGALWAARYGAAAVLVRSVQTGNGPPHTGAVNYSSKIPKIPAAALSVEDADRLERLLCPGKDSDDPTSSQLCDGKASVHLRIAPKQSARTQDNVVIRIPGTTQPKEIVLLGAHLDSHDATPGAADDAAGVASVLAVMREFARNPPARTILFVLFADEELDGSGALAFVKHHEEELPQIVAATEIDDGDGAPRALQITASETETAAAILTLRRIADSVGSDASGLELRAETGAYGADIEPLWKKHGIPEIAIPQDFTNYFDKHHAKNDTPENVDLDGLGRTTFLLIRVMQVLTSGAATPLHRTAVAR